MLVRAATTVARGMPIMMVMIIGARAMGTAKGMTLRA